MVLCCNIQLGVLTFTAIAEIETVSSWRNFTDTAKVRVPRALYYLKDGRPTKITKPINEILKTGDLVKIQLGYNREYVTEFEGYISRSPKPSFPYEIECEDEMFQLKRKTVSISRPKATVRQILEQVAPGYEIDCPDEVYGRISLMNTTPVKVFDHLRKTAGLYTFFRGKRLVCGQVYDDPKVTDTVANYVFGKNIINDNLSFVSGEDIQTIIYGNVIQPNGVVVRAAVGREGGNVVRRNFGMDKAITEKELEKILQREFDQMSVTGGYDGELESFGFPYVVHGQTVRVKDTLYEIRDSEHFVDEVRTSFSPQNGYRRTLKIRKTK